MDLSLANWDGTFSPEFGIQCVGEPVLTALYGPFQSAADAEAYRPLVEENGTRLVLTQACDPATYPPREAV